MGNHLSRFPQDNCSAPMPVLRHADHAEGLEHHPHQGWQDKEGDAISMNLIL